MENQGNKESFRKALVLLGKTVVLGFGATKSIGTIVGLNPEKVYRKADGSIEAYCQILWDETNTIGHHYVNTNQFYGGESE